MERQFTEEDIGKFAIYYNGCFAPRRTLEIVKIHPDGDRADIRWCNDIIMVHHMEIKGVINENSSPPDCK